ncbi:MAG: hypothetical protein KatS3mg011_0248 [Acidimicrobiia bacterium]|nr:MAG: hypothetical protein KatS3mg011_0248 [Acidimicrobiia bacterium]
MGGRRSTGSWSPGASAGAHLAALLALDEQTKAAGAVVFYGVYDFLNRHRTRPDWPLIPRKVMHATPEQRPDLYRLASPLDQIRPGAPPFMVVHGDHDSLVPPAESRIFVAALREAGIPVRYLEVRGAQHAFDVFPTPRARAAWGAAIGFCLDVAEGELPAGGC